MSGLEPPGHHLQENILLYFSRAMSQLKRIYLTIDDGPTDNTDDIVEFLKEKSIPAIMFFCGESIERNEKAAQNAIKNGFIIGNHSFYHKYFSSIPLKEALEDINRTERIIENLYVKCGYNREMKLFRFPYGDKGYRWTKLNVLLRKLNKKYRKIQEFLSYKGFDKIDSRSIQANIYYKWLLGDIDVFWTFDTNDWQLGKGDSNYSYSELDNHLENLKRRPKDEIILMHDRADTAEYLFYIVEKLISYGYIFDLPLLR